MVISLLKSSYKEMMDNRKIGIVSCYFQPNYGSQIQALATQMALDKLGYENETINIAGLSSEIRKRKIKYFAKAALTSDILLSKYGMAANRVRRKLVRDDYSILSRERQLEFEEFYKKNFRLSEPYTSFGDLSRKCAEKYSSVLAGSDQLWLPANIAADYYTLNWVPGGVNTIAYATSFGQSALPDDIEARAAGFLHRIRHVSIREESGQKLVKKICGRDVPIVCDPTLLFTGDQWLSIQQEEPIVREPYIFCYFLGNNPSHREFARHLRKETGLRIVALTNLDEYVKSDNDYADAAPYNINPADFLNLIRNAAFVCTDSFHCSVFSILYEREFFTFRRYARKTKSSTNSRIDTLFHMCGIQGRLLQGSEPISDCLKIRTDYHSVHNNISEVREASYQYLIDALENKRSTDCD